jgi:Na+-transporting NADH:ubiquinone oxidoreductase subunit F
MNALVFDAYALALGTLATAAVLGLALALGKRLRAKRGGLRIRINKGGRKLAVQGGLSLLATLQSKDVFLPSACGGTGSCGTCKCKVLSDAGPILPTEAPYLGAEEIGAGYRLACQIKVERDLEIEIPEAFLAIKKYKARLARLRELTYDTKELYFDLQGRKISFRPGQYVQLVIPPHDKIKESVLRAYSMSSSPGDEGHVEILVRLVPGGIASSWVHASLREGDGAELVGPFGEFRVRESDATLLCVAGGSGMAPFRSIFRHMEETDAWAGREVWYFFGAKSARDLFYIDELEELERRLPRFHLVAALSDPRPEDAWKGETGLITEVLDRYIKGKIPADRPFEGYLCGSPGMINSCTKVMTRNGVPADKIYFDKFS